MPDTLDYDYGYDHDLDTPWGIETFLEGEPIVRITKPTQFIRLCFRMSEEKQYRTIVYEVDDWPRNPVVVDTYSVSAVVGVWRSLKKFGNKKKLVRMVQQGGPLHLIQQCFTAIDFAKHR